MHLFSISCQNLCFDHFFFDTTYNTLQILLLSIYSFFVKYSFGQKKNLEKKNVGKKLCLEQSWSKNIFGEKIFTYGRCQKHLEGGCTSKLWSNAAKP